MTLTQKKVVKTYQLARKHNLQTLHKTLDFHFARIRDDEPVEKLDFLKFLGVRHLYVHCTHNQNFALFASLSILFPNVEYIEVFSERDLEEVDDTIGPYSNFFSKLKLCVLRTILHKNHTVILKEIVLGSITMNIKTFDHLDISAMPKLPIF